MPVALSRLGRGFFGPRGLDTNSATRTCRPRATSTSAIPAADTRAKVLKAKVTVSFENVAVGEAMKTLSDQAGMAGAKLVKFTYAPEIDRTRKVTYAATDKPVDEVLNELFSNIGLGYVVVSEEGGPRDGWLRITVGGERGFEKGADPDAMAAEKAAADRLDLAKSLLKDGKPERAKPLLTLVVKKHPGTKAAAEAAALLEKLDK